MSGQSRRTAPWSHRVLDAVAYAVGLTGLAVAVSLPPSLLFGAGLVGIKFGTFLVGFAYFGYASYLLQPAKPWADDDEDAGRVETTVERVLANRPPLSWYPVHPEARFSPGVKLFLASLVTLGASYALETVFNVAA